MERSTAFIIGCLVLLCTACSCGLLLLGLVVIAEAEQTAAGTPVTSEVITALSEQPPLTESPPTMTPPPAAFILPVPAEINQTPLTPAMQRSLERLWLTEHPAHDYYAVYAEMSGEEIGPRTKAQAEFELGDTQSFNTELGEIEATLKVKTEHLYLWVEDGLNLNQGRLERAAERFEEQYYPQLQTIFGQEWRPGMDEDGRFSVLHLSETEGGELGYFDSIDEFPQEIFEDSNEQEIIYLNMDGIGSDSELYDGTLVHEYQHLAQWNADRNELSWLDEGLAQYAEYAVGLESFDVEDFIVDPGLQFNTWSDEEEVVYAHYAAAALFAIYFGEQLGHKAVHDLATHPANGLQAVRQVLAEYRPEQSLEHFVADWQVANFWQSDSLSPRYDYEFYFSLPSHDQRVNEFPFTETNTLNQYGAYYLEIETSGSYTISFAGDNQLEWLGIAPHSGEQVWLAPAADGLYATLTQQFDLTAVSEATLNFWTWYELEDGYDFAYVRVSADGGQSWEILEPLFPRTGDYGPGFSGKSANQRNEEGGWVPQTISLSDYAGQAVLLQFLVLTDPAVAEAGFAIDDITIPEIGYNDPAEEQGGWTAAGFVHTSTNLPQQWVVQLVQYAPEPSVDILPLNSLSQGQWAVEIPDSATLVISPMTPFTTKPADYWLSIERE